MKIEGKAEQAFFEWYVKADLSCWPAWTQLPEICQDELLVEWLGSVGIDVVPFIGINQNTKERDGWDYIVTEGKEEIYMGCKESRKAARHEGVLIGIKYFNSKQ